MKKNIIIAVVVLVFFGIGIFIGKKLPKKITIQGVSKEDSFQSGWSAAKQRLNESRGGRVFSEGMEIKNINGIIEKIEGNKITVKINSLNDPLSDPDLDFRIVTIDVNTKISSMILRDRNQVNQEMQEFQDKMKIQREQAAVSTQVEPVMPPESFEKKVITLADLKVAQYVSVTASSDIKDKKEFTATQIDAR